MQGLYIGPMQSLKHSIALVALLLLASPAISASVSDQSRITAAADQLARSQLDSGYFPYDFDFATGNQTDMSHIEHINLVRQCGAAFSLGEYLLKHDSEPVRHALALFLAQAERNSLPVSKSIIQSFLEATGLYNRWQLWGWLGDVLDSVGLLYQPDGEARLVAAQDDYEMAVAGATAFALLAALDYRQVTGDERFDDIIHRWKKGLLTLKVSGRGIRHSPLMLEESHHYNSESWLALAGYTRSFPEDKPAAKAVANLDSYLIDEYTDKFRPEIFHWGMMAAALRYETTGQDLLKDFMNEQVELFLEHVGHAFPEGNSCPLVEGLATYLGTVTAENTHEKLRRVKAREFIYRAMSVNRRLQIDENTARKLHIKPAYDSQLQAYMGAFLKSAREPMMRIDRTQHCLNALLRMEAAGLSRTASGVQ